MNYIEYKDKIRVLESVELLKHLSLEYTSELKEIIDKKEELEIKIKKMQDDIISLDAKFPVHEAGVNFLIALRIGNIILKK